MQRAISVLENNDGIIKQRDELQARVIGLEAELSELSEIRGSIRSLEVRLILVFVYFYLLIFNDMDGCRLRTNVFPTRSQS